MASDVETLGDRYELLEAISVGGTTRVMHARDGRLNRDVAIKLPRSSFAEKYPGFRSLFVKEAMLLSRLDHPNIIPLYDYHESAEGPVLVMRHCPFTLGHRMRDERLDPTTRDMDARVRILRLVASALDYCARVGFSHRDLKPSNVLIDVWNHPYLIDFGFAAPHDDDAKWRSAVGSMQYISPEALLENKVPSDAGRRMRSDHFALGILAYEMLTGVQPLDAAAPGKYPDEWANCTALRMMRGEEPVPASERSDRLPSGVDSVLRQMMSVDPDDRYKLGRGFVNSLDDALQKRNVQGTRIMVSYSRADEEFVRPLVAELIRIGYDVWYDKLIDPGSDWDDQIEAAMTEAKAMVVILSPDFCRSSEAKHEWKYWLDYIGKPSVPVLLSDCRPPYRLSSLQRVNVERRSPTEIAKQLHQAIRGAMRRATSPADAMKQGAEAPDAARGVGRDREATRPAASASHGVPPDTSSVRFSSILERQRLPTTAHILVLLERARTIVGMDELDEGTRHQLGGGESERSLPGRAQPREVPVEAKAAEQVDRDIEERSIIFIDGTGHASFSGTGIVRHP